jgi:hypothetical protein
MGQTETFDSPPRHGTAGFRDLLADIGSRPGAVALALSVVAVGAVAGPGAVQWYTARAVALALLWVLVEPRFS